MADRWAALGAAFVILYNAWRQLRPAILELGDIAPDPSVETKVRTIAGRVPGVIGLDKCFVRKMGFNFYVDLHIVVNGELSVRKGHRIAHEVEEEALELCHKYQKCSYTLSRKKNWRSDEPPRIIGDRVLHGLSPNKKVLGQAIRTASQKLLNKVICFSVRAV